MDKESSEMKENAGKNNRKWIFIILAVVLAIGCVFLFGKDHSLVPDSEDIEKLAENAVSEKLNKFMDEAKGRLNKDLLSIISEKEIAGFEIKSVEIKDGKGEASVIIKTGEFKESFDSVITSSEEIKVPFVVKDGVCITEIADNPFEDKLNELGVIFEKTLQKNEAGEKEPLSGEENKEDIKPNDDKPSSQQGQKPDNPPGDVHKHSYTYKVTKSASCKETGIKTYTCSCGDSYTETIPKTEHSYKNTVVAPTTEAQGYTLHKCSVCGSEYKDNYIAKLPKEEAHQHSWQPLYKTVHHDAVGHYENVLVQDAWDEPVYEWKEICRTCGAWFNTADEVGIHCVFEHGGGSYYAGEVQVDTIHHDAVYENRFIEEKAAYDEQVLTGYSCSCGATKDAE